MFIDTYRSCRRLRMLSLLQYPLLATSFRDWTLSRKTLLPQPLLLWCFLKCQVSHLLQRRLLAQDLPPQVHAALFWMQGFYQKNVGKQNVPSWPLYRPFQHLSESFHAILLFSRENPLKASGYRKSTYRMHIVISCFTFFTMHSYGTQYVSCTIENHSISNYDAAAGRCVWWTVMNQTTVVCRWK